MLMGTLMGQLDPIKIIIRLKTTAANQKSLDRLEESIKICELFLSGSNEHQVTLNRQARLIRDVSMMQLASLRELCFNLGIFITAPHPINKSIY